MEYAEQEYDGFRQEMATVLADTERRGIKWQGTRYATYLKVLDAAAKQEYPRRTKWSKEHAHLWEGAVQCRMLTFSHRLWALLDPGLLNSKLKLVFDGAPYSAGEADGPRNTLLELVTAFCFSDRGFSPELTKDTADIILTLRDSPLAPFAVECKRPAKLTTFRKNLQALRTQIPRRYSETVPHGIAVIGIDRILELAQTGASSRSRSAIETAIGYQQSQVQKQLLDLMKKPHTDLFPAIPLFATILTGTVLDRAAGIPVTIVHMGLSCSGPESHPVSQHYYKELGKAVPLATRPGIARPRLIGPGHWSTWPPNLRGQGR